MFRSPYMSGYRVTSPYGLRRHPISGNFTKHNGVDMVGDLISIVAIGRGIVKSSYYSSSYGHTIIIQHKINGVIWESLYAHLSRRFVDKGDKVSSNEIIGYEGSTGNSTGRHLHLELHRGSWNINKSNSVDPLKYIDNKNLKIDGIIGKQTIKSLQRFLKVEVDGIQGVKTNKALQRFLNKN